MLSGLDLFSGIGGLTLALRDWIEPLAYCECDRYAQGVLFSRMATGELPLAPIASDICDLQAYNFTQTIDVIYGGFPCQDISVAGNGAGLEGKRSGLFFEVIRLVRELRPNFIFLENVPAITVRGLIEFSWSSLRSGMILDGRLYQPANLEPRTLERDGSYLPTTTASDYGKNQGRKKDGTVSGRSRYSLTYLARHGQIATPRAREVPRSPTFRKGRSPAPSEIAQQLGGALNPQWVEWLMGYRTGWTALKDWAMQWFRTKPKKRLKD